MKGIIIGPRGCGKSWLISNIWFKNGDVIIDPFFEHGAKGRLKGNVFNLEDIAINKRLLMIQDFINNLPVDYNGTVFIDSADCYITPSADWLTPYFTSEKYKHLNIVIVSQSIARVTMDLLLSCDVTIVYEERINQQTGKWDLKQFQIRDSHPEPNLIGRYEILRLIKHLTPALGIEPASSH